jgi:hypothetical protein
MSALGHKRTFGNVRRESALPPKADMAARFMSTRLACQQVHLVNPSTGKVLGAHEAEE